MSGASNGLMLSAGDPARGKAGYVAQRSLIQLAATAEQRPQVIRSVVN
jgi:hypothetical protein